MGNEAKKPPAENKKEQTESPSDKPVTDWQKVPDIVKLAITLMVFFGGTFAGYIAAQHRMQGQIDDLRQHFHEANGSFELAEILKEKSKSGLDELQDVSANLYSLRDSVKEETERSKATIKDVQGMQETVAKLQVDVPQLQHQIASIDPIVASMANMQKQVPQLRQRMTTIESTLDSLEDSQGAKIANIIKGMSALVEASDVQDGADLNSTFEELLKKLGTIKIEGGKVVFSMPVEASGFSTTGKLFYVIDDSGDAVLHMGSSNSFFEAVYRRRYAEYQDEDTIWLTRFNHDGESLNGRGIVYLDDGSSEWESSSSDSGGGKYSHFPTGKRTSKTAR